MKYRDVERGINEDQKLLLERTLVELETELQFIPASQDRTTISIDSLVQLIRAAKDGLVAGPLFDALEPASQELEEIGRAHVSSSMGKVATDYLILHPELKN